MTTKSFLIQGKVQGVSFRFHCREKARELGVTGYVRNLPDGSVEVLASGAPASVQLLLN
ncbi:MAG: acylphosphatase, partial [Chitinophagaceae bacterium]